MGAENAFNTLNRQLAQKNVEIHCSALQHALLILINSSNLSVNNTILTSTEGPTQGDPLAKAMYGTGIISLIELLPNPNVTINGTQMMDALEVILRVSVH